MKAISEAIRQEEREQVPGQDATVTKYVCYLLAILPWHTPTASQILSFTNPAMRSDTQMCVPVPQDGWGADNTDEQSQRRCIAAKYKFEEKYWFHPLTYCYLGPSIITWTNHNSVNSVNLVTSLDWGRVGNRRKLRYTASLSASENEITLANVCKS